MSFTKSQQMTGNFSYFENSQILSFFPFIFSISGSNIQNHIYLLLTVHNSRTKGYSMYNLFNILLRNNSKSNTVLTRLYLFIFLIIHTNEKKTFEFIIKNYIAVIKMFLH